MSNKITAHVSFDIPAILSNPVLGFANATEPGVLSEKIEKLNITEAIFRFQKVGGTFFEKSIKMSGIGTSFGSGKINTIADLDASSEYDVTITLKFSDKDDVVSDIQRINTADDTEYGQIAKRIFELTEGGRTRPLAGATIEINNPDGTNWTATSRALDGLVYLQRIPVGSYEVVSITKDGYDALEPTHHIEVTPEGVDWNDQQPVYVLYMEARPTGE